MKVDLRGGDVDVPHVCRKQWELIEGIMAFLVPLVEPMRGEGVTQVVDARLLSSPWAGETATDQDIAEMRFDVAMGEFSPGVAKEWVLWRAGRVAFATHSKVDLEPTGKRRRKRHQSFLMELGVPKREDIFLEVDVLDLEIERLAEPQAAGINEEDEGLQGPAHKHARMTGLVLSRCHEDFLELVDGVDVGFERPDFEVSDAGGGVGVGDIDADQVAEQPFGELDLFIFGRCGMPRNGVNPIEQNTLIDLVQGTDRVKQKVVVEVEGGRGSGKTRIAHLLHEVPIGLDMGGEETVQAWAESWCHGKGSGCRRDLGADHEISVVIGDLAQVFRGDAGIGQGAIQTPVAQKCGDFRKPGAAVQEDLGERMAEDISPATGKGAAELFEDTPAHHRGEGVA